MEQGNEYDYTVNICLTNYYGAEIVEHEDSCGRIKRCLLIPIEDNCLFEKDNTVWAGFYMNRLRYRGKITHFLNPKYSKEKLQNLVDGGYTRKRFGNVYRVDKSHD